MAQPLTVTLNGKTYIVERSFKGKQTLEKLIQQLLFERLIQYEKDWTSSKK